MAKVIKNQQTEIHFSDFYYFTPILCGYEGVLTIVKQVFYVIPLLSVMLLQGLMVTESGDNPYRRLYPVLSAVQSLWMR